MEHLDHVVDNQPLLTSLVAHLNGIHLGLGNNALFLKEVKEYKRQPDAASMKRKGEQIQDSYFSVWDPEPLQVPSYQAISALKPDSFTRATFDGAAMEAFQLILPHLSSFFEQQEQANE